jgi:hypothetical protein
MTFHLDLGNECWPPAIDLRCSKSYWNPCQHKTLLWHRNSPALAWPLYADLRSVRTMRPMRDPMRDPWDPMRDPMGDSMRAFFRPNGPWQSLQGGAPNPYELKKSQDARKPNDQAYEIFSEDRGGLTTWILFPGRIMPKWLIDLYVWGHVHV